MAEYMDPDGTWVIVDESGASAFSDCCGCGGSDFDRETGVALTRALMALYGIKEADND